MSLIEGIGDEVIQFFVVVFIIVVGLLAWWSTSIAEQPLVRAVLVLEMMTRQRLETNSTAQPTGENSIDTGQIPSPSNLEEESETAAGDVTNSLKENSEVVSSPSGDNTNSSSGATFEDTEVVNDVESSSTNEEGTDVIRKRLAYFEKKTVTPHVVESSTTGSDSHTEDVPESSVTHPPNENTEEDDNDENSPGVIRIRLKYLNDTQKLVVGNLEEQLGEFKRRHFGLEIQTNKLVRLIFNGQVLLRDSETLQNYGLFDNCVVHCLVHNQRPVGSNASGNSVEVGQANGVNVREWDMDNHLFGSLSFILVAAWYCRYTYAQLFTTTTTVALVCLTGVFFVSLLSVYLPEQGRERQ
ncbi:transmembrane and ubiquitin-like domain-containing protein 1 [Ischnura elegans]|uniref:transmembrane and ubiquitin-like domain-containing protein 1 n=1 Tax=Ischnura elegans TaxID=197161 RepID=UPI001ED8A545|nr:transmembrane and ubiquitin-like domain-containing protein 1 [Ischnura elegans]XP_046393971.1 transmembrane and ubiquitin-like domain-containing protein 1 [Ischnura elegans]XP_046393972.1 transmembrane and ubiquitin-like domain-containing protein 1 [Ischnura elegans]XP_046393973.1 transmembrane and ubiquitin-like domain-containing protein 1 [Ischnura elegans]